MSKSLYILSASLLMILISCNKVENAKRDLSGVWNLIEYSYTNFSGLTYKYPAAGTLEFENCSEDLCNYSLNMYYINQTDTSYRNDQGYYRLYDNAENYDLYKVDTSGIIDTLENGRIILLTKSDLKIQFTENYQTYHLILEKN